MKKHKPALDPILRQIVAALRMSDDHPESHARALAAYLQLARESVPLRGIFDPGSRDENTFFQRIHAVGNKHLGLSSAKARFTRAVEGSRLPFEKQDAILSSALDFQDVSDTAYFYAGLAFALAFVRYGTAFAAASEPKKTKTR
jgi:hypothetical protein